MADWRDWEGQVNGRLAAIMMACAPQVYFQRSDGLWYWSETPEDTRTVYRAAMKNKSFRSEMLAYDPTFNPDTEPVCPHGRADCVKGEGLSGRSVSCPKCFPKW